MTDVRPLGLEGVLEIVPKRFGDDRGFFSETYNSRTLLERGVDVGFVQDNHSCSSRRGTLRGLHYQLEPRAQWKLVRVVRGAVFDVAVDIRPESADFGRWVSLEITANKWNQVLIPAGFAHGFLTLEDDTEVIYKVSEFYSPDLDRSIRFDDPDIAIRWPIEPIVSLLSKKDFDAPLLREAISGT